MASRTSAGTSVWVTITILGLLTVGLFVTTIFFYSKMSKAQGEVLSLEENYEEIIRPQERGADNVQATLNAARGERQSLVDFLMTNNRQLKRLATGSPDLTLEQVQSRAVEATGNEGESLVTAVNRLRTELRGARSELADAKERLDTLQADVSAELARLQTIEGSVQQTAQEATQRVEDYRSGVDELRTRVESFETRVQRDVDRERAEFREEIQERESRIADLNQQILVLRDQVRRLRGESGADRVTPVDEYALVDGEVAAVQPGEGNVVITLGREDKLVIGMTFSVYGSASEIRPGNAAGTYVPGKATIEVISIDEGSATARIVRSSRGNPVVAGDVIANPVYDPNKTYKFVVFGNFDVNRDGAATPYERDQLVAIIERWGGQVIDEITGDLDFLVLGRKPVEPLQPAPNAPRAVYDEYLRLQNRVERYDELFQEATAASIPVLNENRLRTLIGEIPR